MLHLFYALASLAPFQACLEDLLQVLEDLRLVSMHHSHHQDCRAVPWDHWEAVGVQELVLPGVLHWDQDYWGHHHLWGAKVFRWTWKREMREEGRIRETPENVGMLGAAAETTGGRMRVGVGGDGRVRREGAEGEMKEEEEEGEEEMMTEEEGGMVTIETIGIAEEIGTEIVEIEIGGEIGAHQEEVEEMVEVEIWPLGFKVWLVLKEMEVGGWERGMEGGGWAMMEEEWEVLGWVMMVQEWEVLMG